MVLGEHDKETIGETNLTVKHRVQKIVVHKTNKGKPSRVDIALLKVRLHPTQEF